MPVGQFDHVVRVGQVLAQQGQHLVRVEGLGVVQRILVGGGIHPAKDRRPVRAHHEVRRDVKPSENRLRRVPAASGRQHHLVPRGDRVGDRIHDPRAHRLVFEDHRAVDVESDEDTLRSALTPHACARELFDRRRRIGFRLDLDPAGLGQRVRTHAIGSMTSRPPRKGLSTSGTVTDPSSR